MEEDAFILEEFDETPPPAVTASTEFITSTTSLPSTTLVTSLLTEAAKFLTSSETPAMLSSSSISTSSSTTEHPTTSTTTWSSSSSSSFFSNPASTTPFVEPTLADGDPANLLFSTVDYVIFAALLLLSALIGVYFGFVSKIKQNNTKEYLLGGKTMSKFPVSASLIAT
uniref:Sodium-coupled monocarboxylate transporter 1 n=2 Tax=Culex pipiens TaxID=7175 RepID=A0A8D8DPY0_CULPI